MTTDRLGRLFDHVHLRVADLDASRRFYTAVLVALGRTVTTEADCLRCDELYIDQLDPDERRPDERRPDERRPDERRPGERRPVSQVHLAFQARSREAVDRFFAAGIAAGGCDHGPPGERPYHARYYAAFLLDPDGNNIEAVHHGPVHRSASEIIVTRP